MIPLSSWTKINIILNKCNFQIVQLNFKTKVVSLPGSKEMFPPESRMICREILKPIPLPPSLVVKKGMKICSAMSWGIAGPLLDISTKMASASLQ